MRAGTAYSNLCGQEQLREGERPLGAARKGEEVDRVEKGEGSEEEMILKRIIHQIIQIEIKIICFIETYDLEILSLLSGILPRPRKKRSPLECPRTWRFLRYQKVLLKQNRSMIATLPGGRPFMGDHLEVVCLLQAG